MKTWVTLGFLLGLSGIVTLVAWQGFDTIAAALASLGWGVFLLPLVFLPHLALAALSWRLLFRPKQTPPLALVFRAMWIGLSVDTLLPLASIGGEIVKIRLLMQAGVRGPDAGASVVVDKTVQAISLVLWGLVGVALLISFEAENTLVAGALLALALLSLGVAGFIRAQYAGSFTFLVQLFDGSKTVRSWTGLVDNTFRLDATIRSHYRKYGRLLFSCLLRLLARVALTTEVWLAAALMGQGITFWEALMLKSLTGALRGMVFVVPGALGIQEGGYVVLGVLLGISPDLMLAISLATRARELLVSLPGLLAWQHVERQSL